jgi:hypothetical protein
MEITMPEIINDLYGKGEPSKPEIKLVWEQPSRRPEEPPYLVYGVALYSKTVVKLGSVTATIWTGDLSPHYRAEAYLSESKTFDNLEEAKQYVVDQTSIGIATLAKLDAEEFMREEG